MHQSSAILAAVLSFGTRAATQQVVLTYRTATITQCFTATGLPPVFNDCAPTPVIRRPAAAGAPICVEIQAPNCRNCGCDTCVQTISYTTAYDAFCSTGLYKQEYAVTETYSGVAAKPTIPAADVPLGFTRDVEVCTTCGPTPVTATITRPIEGATQGTAVSNSPLGVKGADTGSNGVSPAPDSNQTTIVTADSPSIMPLVAGHSILIFMAFSMTGFVLY